MANTPFQIKKNTTLETPTSLLYGEFGLYSNGANQSMWIGAHDGSVVRFGGSKYSYLHRVNSAGVSVANAVVTFNSNGFMDSMATNKLIIGDDGTTANITSISTFANSSRLGSSALGSNTEIVPSWAIKTYVDGRVANSGGGASTLNDLTDVDLSGGVSNGRFFAYNGVSSAWGARSLTGNNDQISVTSNNTTSQISLASNVTVSRLNATNIYAR